MSQLGQKAKSSTARLISDVGPQADITAFGLRPDLIPEQNRSLEKNQ
jgi:hypothetical protein